MEDQEAGGAQARAQAAPAKTGLLRRIESSILNHPHDENGAYNLIPQTMAMLKEQPGYRALTIRVVSEGIEFELHFDTLIACVKWKREMYDSLALNDEAFLVAVKKVVQAVLPRVIIGL